MAQYFCSSASDYVCRAGGIVAERLYTAADVDRLFAAGMMDDTLWKRLIPVITVAALLIAVGPMVIAAKKYE